MSRMHFTPVPVPTMARLQASTVAIPPPVVWLGDRALATAAYLGGSGHFAGCGYPYWIPAPA